MEVAWSEARRSRPCACKTRRCGMHWTRRDATRQAGEAGHAPRRSSGLAVGAASLRTDEHPLAIRCVLSVVWDFLLKLCFTHFTHCAQPLRAPNPTQAAFSQRDREPQQICVRWCAECVVRLSYYDEHPMTRRRRGGPPSYSRLRCAWCRVQRALFLLRGNSCASASCRNAMRNASVLVNSMSTAIHLSQ